LHVVKGSIQRREKELQAAKEKIEELEQKVEILERLKETQITVPK
jgi:archaellum component FlaC